MKLITEYNNTDIKYLKEDVKGSKKYAIEGIFMQAEKKNRNGRIYPKGILESAIAKYIDERVSKNRAVGELNHPEGPSINVDKVSHKITELKWSGNDVIGKATVLDTPMGKIVKGLIDGDVVLGVSSRGMGNIESRGNSSYVKDGFMLATVDIVEDPSAPDAFVNGIMEGVEWIWDNGLFKTQCIENYETEIKKASMHRLIEVKKKLFVDFLSRL